MTAVNVGYDEQIKIFNSKQAVISGGGNNDKNDKVVSSMEE